MDCQEARQLLHAYADDELDVVLAAKVHEHLASCEKCASESAAIAQLKTAVANPALYSPAPAALKNRIHAATVPPVVLRPVFSWRALSLAASLLLAVGLGWDIVEHRGGADLVADQVVASHVRSLEANHLLDVPSTDQHTVLPWFDGKLDFAPPVHDLAAQGFPLIGGRLDYLQDRPVAALVYRHNKHIINLFIWPGSSGDRTEVRQGYNLVLFPVSQMTCWAVSDLEAGQLEQFTQLFQADSSPATAP
jgi:anti-sigma factor RsiW